MVLFTLSPTLDHTKFNIWEDKLSPIHIWQGWVVIREPSSSKEDLPASLWGPGPERPTVVCLSFHQAWCLLAAAMFSQNPTAQLSYKHLALLLRAAHPGLLAGAENTLLESCRLNANTWSTTDPSLFQASDCSKKNTHSSHEHNKNEKESPFSSPCATQPCLHWSHVLRLIFPGWKHSHVQFTSVQRIAWKNKGGNKDQQLFKGTIFLHHFNNIYFCFLKTYVGRVLKINFNTIKISYKKTKLIY